MENIETLLAAVAQTQGFDDDEPVASAPLELKNSGSAVATRPCPVVETAVPAPSSALSALGPVIGDGEKRKRGRPPKSQVAAYPPPPKRKKVEDEEEDVCFICFDGGSLVLCDRKGCPKAYHPACIKRDEAFFQSKAKWNCGWHICSFCQKASYYMCYTCTYSLCKACTKNADYVRVRGNKGFCATCIKPIMLIENKDQATNESIKVDFDDIHSWEYLFKMYWLLLKEKLSLTLSEITQAKNPFIAAAKEACKPHLSNAPPTAVGGEVSVLYRSNEHLESNTSHLDFNSIQNDGLKTSSKGNCISKLHNNEGQNGPSHKKDLDDSNANKPCISAIESTEWASKDLLEFVAHMKNGDVSPISQFDVQTLLLAYIKTNDLRDPRKRSQIICDQRLKNLFGKPRVGHIEMLKLLEFHVLTKVDSQKNSFIPAGFVSSTATDMENDVNKLGLAEPVNSRKRKTRKKSENNALQHDLNEYAAIDAHNINLIYLRRKLMENLIDDRENLDNKVIGSIVRIRISTNDQKPEVHRLVQVVGTTVTAEPYKFADKTTHIMLEVLNLDKKEIVSIDSISNQEFTKEECRRLRQSVRCGLVKHFTIGEVQKKAAALQSVRVNDWLETEVSRLNHLRDRASEKGHKKELREYVDRLQLLNSPEERNRRISEAPMIHADPKMSPYYESEEDNASGGNGEKDEYVIPSYSRLPRNRRNTNSNRKGKEDRSPEVKRRVKEKAYTTQININTSLNGNRNDQRSMLEASTATASVENSPSADNMETEKLWHYRDPNGKIQGPFSIMQLRKWSKTGLFPPDMRIWTNHEQYDSLLLTDALIGKFHTPLKENKYTDGASVTEVSNDTSRDNKQTEVKVDESSSSLENSRSLNFKPPDSSKPAETTDILHLPIPTTKTENPLSVSSIEPTQSSGVFELPKSDTETKPQEFVNLPMPGLNGEEKLPEVADEWCGYSPTPMRQRPSVEEWDPGLVSASPSKPPEIKTEVVDSSSNKPNWSAIMNEPFEFLSLGEDSVSDLLAEVDAMESQGALRSPTAALKFDRELLEDSKDDCFSSIEDFSSVSEPKRSEAISSTSDVHFASQSPAAGKSIGDFTSQSIGDLTSQSSAPSKSIGDAFDFCRRPSVNSSASSEGETNNPVHMNHDIAATSSDPMDPGWGNLQGSNINLVTVQGNVNLVLGGSGSFDWGTNPGPAWANPGPNRSPRNGSCLPWDGQRKYSGERFSSPREWGYQGGGESGFGRGRPPWGRQQYGGGYLRQLPKGQRVCKFYEGGRCKKGANCDYLHP